MSPLLPFHTKSVLASLRVKVMVSGPVKVAPAAPVRESAIVGAVVSVLNWKTTMLAPGVLAPSLVVSATPVR